MDHRFGGGGISVADTECFAAGNYRPPNGRGNYFGKPPARICPKPSAKTCAGDGGLDIPALAYAGDVCVCLGLLSVGMGPATMEGAGLIQMKHEEKDPKTQSRSNCAVASEIRTVKTPSALGCFSSFACRAGIRCRRVLWISSLCLAVQLLGSQRAVAAEPSATVFIVVGAPGEAEYGSNFLHQ